MIKVGITHGDINGIGYEVILKTLADRRMCELCTPVIYGSARVAEEYKKSIHGAGKLTFNTIQTAKNAHNGKVNLVNCCDEKLTPQPGSQTKIAGEAAVAALEKAVEELKNGAIDVLVTAPINKENVQSEAFNFTGHTEFMASHFKGEALMMMCSELMKVGLVTIHIPLSEVSKNISKELIVKRLKQLKQTLIEDFTVVEPRIAVLALNPHAGDGGLLGEEEKNVIEPAIKQAYKEGVMAFGPFAADGFFAVETYKKYDAVLAMYHDQGLAPFKALTPHGVNFTAGLDVIRTSPDHGTAYNIAGQGVADEGSMREAIYTAIDIYRSRKSYQEVSKNPLQHYEVDRRGKDMSVKDLPTAEDND